MEERVDKNTSDTQASKNLESYISSNYKKYPLESLKKEATKKGYHETLFDEVYKKVMLKEANSSQDSKTLFYKTGTSEEENLVMTPIEKEKLIKLLKDSENLIRRFFEPTQIMTYAFCIIFLIAVGVSLADSFSMQSIVFSDPNISGEASFFEIGYPLVFISISFAEENPFKINFFNLIVCLSLYALIAYIIDLILSNSIRTIKKSIENDIKEEAELEKV